MSRLPAMRHILTKAGRPLGLAAKRYPLLFVAVGFSVGILATSTLVARNINHKTKTAFNPEKVLPNPISQPAVSNAVFTADSITQYNGKDGKPCYVAVNGVVYEIKSQYWQNGKHTPSDGQAYCGADMTDIIGKSPHGTSVLTELPRVGTYKAS